MFQKYILLHMLQAICLMNKQIYSEVYYRLFLPWDIEKYISHLISTIYYSAYFTYTILYTAGILLAS